MNRAAYLETSTSENFQEVWINNKLVGILYCGQAWSNQYKQDKMLKAGVNFTVYALIKKHLRL